MKGLTGVVGLVGSLCLASSLSGCSGGGDGGGVTTAPSTSSATAAPTIVSGSVQAPAGLVAFFKESAIGDLLVSDAYAALTGLAPVPDHTIVQLARLNTNASGFAVLSTTVTSAGRYSFDLTALGLQPANDLIVRVAGPGGKEMRAFVVGSSVDLNPASEAAYQLAIQSLSGGPFSNLTLQEVTDITGAVGLIAALQNIGNATSVDQAAALVKTAVGTNAQVTAFLAAAAGPGQTISGAGDVGNFFPFETGSVWTYSGMRNVQGSSISYENTVTVTGVGPVPGHGVSATIYSDSNDEGQGRPEKTYMVKDQAGITEYGNDDPDDNLTRQLVPFQGVHFPLSVGVTTLLAERSGLDWGDDEDGDLRNETFTAKLFQTVVGLEQITVPAGTFPNALRIEQKAVLVVNFSRGGSGTVLQTGTVWHAPGIGKVKSIVEARVEGGPVQASLVEALSSYSVNGASGGVASSPAPPPPPPPPAPPVPTLIQLTDSGNATFLLDQEKVYEATVFDALSNPIANASIVWQYSDPSVLSFRSTTTNNSVVKAIAPGSSTIVASSSGLVSTPITVTVIDMRWAVAGADLGFDHTRQRFYIPSGKERITTDGAIISYDPAAHAVANIVTAGDPTPGKMAVSYDGQFLYVVLADKNSIKRFRLPDLVSDQQFSLGSDPNGLFQIEDIVPVPGSPQSVALVRTVAGQQGGVAIYDNGVPRPTATPGFGSSQQSPAVIRFSQNSGTLYGFKGDTIFTMAVTSNGVSISNSHSLGLPAMIATDPQFDAGLIYVNSGEIIDAGAGTIVGKFQHPLLNAGGSVRPDSALGKTFFVAGNPSSPTILIFNQMTHQLLASRELSNIDLLRGVSRPPSRLVRWGVDGLAFMSSYTFLFKLSLIQ
jgi:hypothetical protein